MTLRLLLTTAAVLTSVAGFAGEIKIISDRALPDAVGSVFDIRWASSNSVYMTAAAEGVLEVNTTTLSTRVAAHGREGGRGC